MVRKRKIKKFRYKLIESELDRMVYRGVISMEQRDLLIRTSKLRKPNCYAKNQFQIVMNQCGTIKINSINRYGGEDFGRPFHFLAEIVHNTTPSVFTRFMHERNIPKHPFNK